jgi:Mechanosensitive ion channel, conserved TM helix
METKIQDQFLSFADSLLAYLPNLLGGIILILLGWLLGWVVKKILVQLSIILHIDRFLQRARFEADFSKADVRYSLYNFIGNIGFWIIFLIFLDNAFFALKLKILSDLLSQGILFLPKIIIAAITFIIGWLLASWVQMSVLKSLGREDIPRASLISRFIKGILMIFFSAISLVELDVAREIVIIGFGTIFVTLGAIAIVITVVGGKNFLKRIEDSLKEEKPGK